MLTLYTLFWFSGYIKDPYTGCVARDKKSVQPVATLKTTYTPTAPACRRYLDT
jgi:hypothetical protein